MADLNDFGYTDDLNDVLAIYVNNLLASTMRSEYKNVETLSADRTLTDADTPIQRLDCNGAARIVKVPTVDAVANHPFFIVNSSSGAYAITLKSNDGATTITTIAQGKTALVIPDGAGTYKLVGDSAIPNDGWTAVTLGSPTRVSGTTFTTTTDLTGLWSKFLKLKFTDTTTKYAHVVALSAYSAGSMTVTIVGDALVGDPSAFYYASAETPFGFPLEFDYDWAPTGITTTTGTTTSKFSIHSGLVHGHIDFKFGASSAVTGAVTFTLPVAVTSYAVDASSRRIIGRAGFLKTSATAGVYTGDVGVNGSSTLGDVRASNSSGTYDALTILSSAIPFTWVTGDSIGLEFVYAP